METNIVIICSSHDIFLTHTSFSFALKDRQRTKNRNCVREFKKIMSYTASISLRICKVDSKLCEMKTFWPRWHHQWRQSGVTLNIVLYSHFYETVALRACFKVIILGHNAKNVIMFLGYTLLNNMLRNKTFQDRRSKSQGHQVTMTL